MIWFFLLVPVAPFMAIYLAWSNWGWWGSDQVDKWFTLLLGTLFTGVFTLVFIGLSYGIARGIGGLNSQVWERGWSGNMVSMRSSDGVQGSISGGVFLTRGYIGSTQVYYYYTKRNDGSLQPHHWNADSDVSIFEEDRIDGEVIQFEPAFKHKWLEYFAIPEQGRYRMDFHIPTGSVRQAFEVQ